MTAPTRARRAGGAHRLRRSLGNDGAMHERIDALQAEIVSRYKTGEASVDGLLA